MNSPRDFLKISGPLATIGALLLSGCSGPAATSADEAPVVVVARPVQRTVTDWDESTGRFEAVDQVQVRARVGGFIDSIEFQDGAMVKKGAPLYIIDPRPFQAAAEQARGQLSDAKSRTEFAELEYARATKLIATQAVSENVVDQRQQQLRQGQAAKQQAEGALQRALLDIEFAKITAPISGRIGRHLVGVGNLVDGSDRGATLLTSIVSLDPIYVYFDTTEANYMKYSRLWAEGKRPSSRDTANAVEVALAGEKKPSHPGAVDFVDNRMDGGTGTLRVRAVVPNHDLSILPGQFARVRLIGSAPYEALLLPELAIATDQSRRIVYVVKADDTVDVRTVELGPIDDGLRVVKSGIKADDRVVVEGLQRVRAGIKVAPKAAGEKEAAR